MSKLLVFDMDGTIADLYGVEDWLGQIRAENARPYEIAKPLVNMTKLNGLLSCLKAYDYKIVITSWLAKDSTEEFKEEVRQAKLWWLEKWCFPYDEIHLIAYGTTKANCTRKYGKNQILFDDNEKIRDGWSLGNSYSEKEMLKQLSDLLLLESLNAD